MEVRKEKNEQTRYVIESLENMYKNKLDLLKERQISDNNERRLMQGAQKKVALDQIICLYFTLVPAFS